MKWWKWLVTALSGLVILWRDRFSRTAKAKREAYEKAEQKIDNDADTGDLQSSVDDLLNGM